MSLAWLFPLLIVQRIVEVAVSRRNLRRLERGGGREYHRTTFYAIGFLHTMFLVSLFMEAAPWRVPFNLLTQLCLLFLLLLQVVRYWTMASLGEWWNVRIVAVPGGETMRCGPYRFLRHPHYLVVLLEFALLPLLLRSPMTFAAFFPVNILIMRHRIVLEEQVLCETTDYSAKFPAVRKRAD